MPGVENVYARVAPYVGRDALPILVTATPVVGGRAVPLAKKVIFPVGADGPLATRLAVIVVAAVVAVTLLPLQAPVVVAETVVRVIGLWTKLPVRGNMLTPPSCAFTCRVPVKTPRVLGVAVMGSRQSVVASLFVVHVGVPSEKLPAPAVSVYPPDAAESFAAK